MEDLAIGTLSKAMSGLTVRSNYISQDISNIETPGYLAHNVDFESSLRGAVSDGNPLEASAPTVTNSLEPTRVNGNNVNLDEETLAAQQATLQYQLASQAMTNTFNRLKTAIGAG